jgi:lambda repressor-like predicted transcriptional regulator
MTVGDRHRAGQEPFNASIDWTCVFHERAGGLMVVMSGELLKAACAARGWSLTQLAVRARISRPTLRSVLKGRPVRPRTMWKLANALAQAPISSELAQLLEVS